MDLRHRSVVVPVLLAAAALILTGCAKGGADADKTDAPVGPISQRMNDLSRQFDTDPTTAMNTAVEESVAACMQEQGFEYVPQTDTAPAADVPAQGTLDFAKTYGYGITTWQSIPGSRTADTSGGAQPIDDAYQQALWGATDDGSGTWLAGGCYGQAMEAVGDEGLMSSPVLQDLSNLDAQVDQDSRVVAALDGWTGCMAGKGYDYATTEDAQGSIMQRAYSEDGQMITGDALATLQAEEIATATADYGCSTSVVQVRATVRAELETAYYADHKSEVDAYFAQLEAFLARD